MSYTLPFPAPPVQTNSTSRNGGRITTIRKEMQFTECCWAQNVPELQKACFLARICPMQPPRKCQFRNFDYILQEGPTCGLTALSMILNGRPSTQTLLEQARELSMSHNGEMFSAHSLFQLCCNNVLHIASAANDVAKECQENVRHVIECQLHEGRLNCAKVRELLLSNAVIFVPYDADFNNAPCLKFGHKAHWALIVGYLIDANNEFYVISRHGKARNLAIWSLEALSESNFNLVEYAQPKSHPNCDFLLPPGGIGGDLGLKERAIAVCGLPHEIILIR